MNDVMLSQLVLIFIVILSSVGGSFIGYYLGVRKYKKDDVVDEMVDEIIDKADMPYSKTKIKSMIKL